MLHCLQKKTQRTSAQDIALASKRYNELMRAIAEYICSSGMTQAEAVKTLGVTQPPVSDLICGKIDVFSLDTLVDMLAAAEIQFEIRLKKAA